MLAKFSPVATAGRTSGRQHKDAWDKHRPVRTVASLPGTKSESRDDANVAGSIRPSLSSSAYVEMAKRVDTNKTPNNTGDSW